MFVVVEREGNWVKWRDARRDNDRRSKDGYLNGNCTVLSLCGVTGVDGVDSVTPASRIRRHGSGRPAVSRRNTLLLVPAFSRLHLLPITGHYR